MERLDPVFPGNEASVGVITASEWSPASESSAKESLRKAKGRSRSGPSCLEFPLQFSRSVWILVSALGLEPRTHALKGRCSTN